jgi:hypothetical protein
MKRKRGVPKGTIRKGLTESFLLSELRRANKLLGKQVAYQELKKLKGFPSPSVYINRFGSWSKALKLLGLKVPKNGTEKGSKEAISWGKKMALVRTKEVLDKPCANIRMRFQILERDNFMCQYCGRTPQDGAKLVIDHVNPVSNGGKTELSNLITSCFECNSGKTDILLSAHIPRSRANNKRGQSQ